MIYNIFGEKLYSFLKPTPHAVTSRKWAMYKRLYAKDLILYGELFNHLQKQTRHNIMGKKRVYEMEALETQIIENAFKVGINQQQILYMLKKLTS